MPLHEGELGRQLFVVALVCFAYLCFRLAVSVGLQFAVRIADNLFAYLLVIVCER